MKIRTRFAPTPSGFLHLGNAWSFVLTWLAARSQNGSIRLRIDDLDAARCRDEYLDDIFASLQWLGLDWDSGPRDASEFKSSHSQRLRLDRYNEALNRLRSEDRLYACSCSREQIRRGAESTSGAIYPGTCRDKRLDLSEAGLAWRCRVPQNSVQVRDEDGKVFELHPHRDMGDFVLRQKNGDPSYQLASVLDDLDANINFIVRGLDLIPSTGAQMGLSMALGQDVFSQMRFWHHALVLDDGNEKVSKSVGANSPLSPFGGRGAIGPSALRIVREKYPDPLPVYRFFAGRLGLNPDSVFSARDLLEGFKIEKVATMPLRLADFWHGNGE